MKKLFLSVIVAFMFLNAYPQYNFNVWSAGAGGGITLSYTDVGEHKIGLGFHVNGDYSFTPFLSVGAETQFGTIKGGDVVKNPHLRAFENSYKSFAFVGKMQLGQFIDYDYNPFLDAVKGFYLSGGIGVIQNDMKKIVRIKPDGTNYRFPGKDNSTNLVIPLGLGMDFGFKDYYDKTRFILDVGYQVNITFGEGLDGYNDPSSIFKNNAPDYYTYAHVGLKYCFGPESLFYRTFRR